MRIFSTLEFYSPYFYCVVPITSRAEVHTNNTQVTCMIKQSACRGEHKTESFGSLIYLFLLASSPKINHDRYTSVKVLYPIISCHIHELYQPSTLRRVDYKFGYEDRLLRFPSATLCSAHLINNWIQLQLAAYDLGLVSSKFTILHRSLI